MCVCVGERVFIGIFTRRCSQIATDFSYCVPLLLLLATTTNVYCKNSGHNVSVTLNPQVLSSCFKHVLRRTRLVFIPTSSTRNFPLRRSFNSRWKRESKNYCSGKYVQIQMSAIPTTNDNRVRRKKKLSKNIIRLAILIHQNTKFAFVYCPTLRFTNAMHISFPSVSIVWRKLFNSDWIECQYVERRRETHVCRIHSTNQRTNFAAMTRDVYERDFCRRSPETVRSFWKWLHELKFDRNILSIHGWYHKCRRAPGQKRSPFGSSIIFVPGP